MMRRLILCSAFFFLGCDDSSNPPDPAPEPESTRLERVHVIGACPAENGLTLAVTLANGGGRGLPPSVLVPLAPLTTDLFQWRNVSVTPLDEMPQPLAIDPQTLSFTGSDAPRLTIVLVDNSGSFLGLDTEGAVDPNFATDPEAKHLDMLKTMVRAHRPDDVLALIRFNGFFATTVVEPTNDHAVISDALTRLHSSESGATPLARGLIAALELADVYPGKAQVVLFTDGVEDGDPSDLPDQAEPVSMADALMQYAAHEPLVPVFTVQLRPPEATGDALTRDSELAALACTTGGAYLFVDNPLSLDRDLALTLSAALDGLWLTQMDAMLTTTGSALLDVTVEAFGQTGGGRPWIFW